jgi:hypothetical protein
LPNDLRRPVSRINNDGIRRTTVVRDALIHGMTEELHHRGGEIIAILWQMNFQPPDIRLAFSYEKNRSCIMGIEVRKKYDKISDCGRTVLLIFLSCILSHPL